MAQTHQWTLFILLRTSLYCYRDESRTQSHKLHFLSAGFLSDITSTYNEAFYFSGAAIAVCACVLSLVPVFAPLRTRGPSEITDELGQKKRRPSFFERYVQRHVGVSKQETSDTSEVVEYLVVVDKVTTL